MRSRTEMVTTTFVDSEEDYTDDDDSEEDWRPSASSKTGKKQKQQKYAARVLVKKGRKRKSSSTSTNKNFKRNTANEDSEYDELNEPSENGHENDEIKPISGSSKDKPADILTREQIFNKNSSTSNINYSEGNLNLLVYAHDLTGLDFSKINRLCLWRKDDNNLLQKYIRVKTSPDQFLFTSSSVYSSFDDKRSSDFYEIKVKLIDSNRRVKIINPSELQKISFKNSNNKLDSNEDILSDENCKTAANLKMCVKSGKKYNEDDDEEEVEEENEQENSFDSEGDDGDDNIEEYDERTINPV